MPLVKRSKDPAWEFYHEIDRYGKRYAECKSCGHTFSGRPCRMRLHYLHCVLRKQQCTISQPTEDVRNYAEDALKEVLGWYGLHEGAAPEGGPSGNNNSARPNGKNHPAKPAQALHTLPKASTSQPAAHSTISTEPATQPASQTTTKPNTPTVDSAELSQNANTASEMGVKTDYGHSTPLARSTTARSFHCKSDNPLDLTNGHATTAEMLNSSGSTITKGSWTNQRKLIGMRFLFPPLSDDMLLIDRAKIWVRRHDYKYFVGWREEELQTVDPILRPIGTITSDLYKMHMNRSEYCRNVKLKYCLESNTDWAKEFQQMLKKPASDGGFTGLCQAKIAAAELWRKYSEKYRSHQARYPNPKSKYKNKKHQDMPGVGGNDSDTSSKRKSSADDSIDLDDEGTDDSQETKRICLDDDIDLMYDEEHGGSFDPSKIHYESDECHEEGDLIHCSKMPSLPRQEALGSPNVEEDSSHPVVHIPSPKESDVNPSCADDQPIGDVSSQESPMLGGESVSGRTLFPHLSVAPFFGMPLPLYPGATTQYALGIRGDTPFTMDSPLPVKITTAAETLPSAMTTGFAKPRHSDRHHEYKRSERGLSFLFPSLSDHNLSLVDKVRITVLRHKNNYFLGKSEEELTKIDPLVRPKMLVTSDIYKEYCHRNAMKYDSNLQFAMESPERWAVEFRAKLMRPPSEGGFSSLCEVKLEAGRLWREYSGKYRMHNIVKWQMDLNSTVKGSRPDSAEGSLPEGQRPGARSSVTSQEGISPLPVSPSDTSDQDHHIIPSSVKILSPQSSIESMDLSPATTRSVCDTDIASLPRPSTSGVKSPKTMPYDPAGSSGVFDMYQDSHLRVAHSGRRSSRGKEAASKSYPEPVYQLSQPPSGHKARDVLVDKLSELVRPHESEGTSLPDALFQPLPRTMSVAEQVSIWLERHRHNYFLRYPDEERTKLNEFLRPSTFVTRDVFKRYIPESMVDIISKIELIMLSSEPWAIDFQARISKTTQEGGFSTFEEALTEAVVLWNMAKTAYHHQQLLRESRSTVTRSDYAASPQQSPDLPLDLQNLSNRSIKAELESPSGSSLHSQQGASFRYQPVTIVSKVECPSSESDLPANQQQQSVPSRSQSDIDQSQDTPQPKHRSHGGEKKQDHKEPSPTDLLDMIWVLRDKLQQQCVDDPQTTWVDRLHSHLPTLRDNLGPAYVLPNTTSNCIIDYVLSTLHQHMQHITQIVPPNTDSVHDAQDVTVETTS